MSKINIKNASKSVIIGGNVSGSKISISSNETAKLFNEVRESTKLINDAEEREEIVAVINQMESFVGDSRYTELYKEFTQLSANHLTLLTPFIPALSALIA